MFEWLQTNWVDVINVVSYVIAAASIIVKLTPSDIDNKFLAKIVNFLKLISLAKDV